MNLVPGVNRFVRILLSLKSCLRWIFALGGIENRIKMDLMYFPNVHFWSYLKWFICACYSKGEKRFVISSCYLSTTYYSETLLMVQLIFWRMVKGFANVISCWLYEQDYEIVCFMGMSICHRDYYWSNITFIVKQSINLNKYCSYFCGRKRTFGRRTAVD